MVVIDRVVCVDVRVINSRKTRFNLTLDWTLKWDYGRLFA